MSRNSGYYGLNGPNQHSLFVEQIIKQNKKQQEYDEQKQKEMIDYKAKADAEAMVSVMNTMKSSEQPAGSISTPFQPINIVNANTISQQANSITNITLTDDQFRELLDVIKSK